MNKFIATFVQLFHSPPALRAGRRAVNVAAGAVGLALLCGCQSSEETLRAERLRLNAERQFMLPPGCRAPDLKLYSVSEKLDSQREYKLSSLFGKRLLLHFWSTKDPHLERNIASLRTFQTRVGTHMNIVSIATDPMPGLYEFTQVRAMTWSHAILTDEQNAYRLGTESLFVLIDSRGKIAAHTTNSAGEFERFDDWATTPSDAFRLALMLFGKSNAEIAAIIKRDSGETESVSDMRKFDAPAL
jgi:hypothetical protein